MFAFLAKIRYIINKDSAPPMKKSAMHIGAQSLAGSCASAWPFMRKDYA
jgi:hypothetical protein